MICAVASAHQKATSHTDGLDPDGLCHNCWERDYYVAGVPDETVWYVSVRVEVRLPHPLVRSLMWQRSQCPRTYILGLPALAYARTWGSGRRLQLGKQPFVFGSAGSLDAATVRVSTGRHALRAASLRSRIHPGTHTAFPAPALVDFQPWLKVATSIHYSIIHCHALAPARTDAVVPATASQIVNPLCYMRIITYYKRLVKLQTTCFTP
jgi:hypothetical protein